MPKAKQLPNKDKYARLSYTYQIATYTSTLPKMDVLSKYLSRDMDLVAKKNVIRLAPSLKRSICKSCRAILLPGLTSKFSLSNRSNNQRLPQADVYELQCLKCCSTKTFPIGRNKNYVPWPERDENNQL